MNTSRSILLVSVILLNYLPFYGQNAPLVNTTQSLYAKLTGVGVNDITLTNGFWAERFETCKNSMVPHMMANYLDEEISHAFTNFEIAAGIKIGEHVGPPFHDGDFYKMLEGLIMVNSVVRDIETDQKLDSMIAVIALCQRNDGYIHTPVTIEQNKHPENKKEFAERLDFETYNMGHLMTAACLHYRTTGKSNFLNIAIKATDFLYEFFKRNPSELANNAICPSHYMGVVEMYRTTKNTKYLELAKGLINIRKEVTNGTDHNQDRIPFRQQTKAVGHAVRANYLYAGVADVYAETGDDSLLNALNLIWNDLVERKLYITGACGALYDGVSPDGTTYNQPYIQQVHQAYGRDYQLPNLTAHNESCANIGNILWNYRMLLITGDAKFADIMELTMYNSLLSAVSLDGKGYFYTNPLCVSDDVTFKLRWSKEREGYISYCNCCPPNTIRTITEIQNYVYSISDEGLWINMYGGNSLSTKLTDNINLKLTQINDYPWDGEVIIKIDESPDKEYSIFLRIPGWCNNATLKINGKEQTVELNAGTYFKINRKWEKGDIIELNLPMEVKLIEANPLVEETRNQVAVKRGPVVYCLESVDLPDDIKIFDVIIPSVIKLQPVKTSIKNNNLVMLEGEAKLLNHSNWKNILYKEISTQPASPVKIKLIPYFAWDNRGHSEITVWIPVSR